MVNRIAAKSTGGVFYFRLEDTDKKREVEGGAEDILKGLEAFGVIPDEGLTASGEEIVATAHTGRAGAPGFTTCMLNHWWSGGLPIPVFANEGGERKRGRSRKR